MTAHVFSNWDWDDPLDEAPVDRIACCVERNGRRIPPVFMPLTVSDNLVLIAGGLIAEWDGDLDKVTEEEIRNLVHDDDPDAPQEHRLIEDKATAILLRVIERLKELE